GSGGASGSVRGGPNPPGPEVTGGASGSVVVGLPRVVGVATVGAWVVVASATVVGDVGVGSSAPASTIPVAATTTTSARTPHSVARARPVRTIVAQYALATVAHNGASPSSSGRVPSSCCRQRTVTADDASCRSPSTPRSSQRM